MSSRPRLTVDLSATLKRRIESAAAAQCMSVSTYVTRVLQQALLTDQAMTRASDGIIRREMGRRADALRAHQKEPFPKDSAELVREARNQRYSEL